MNPKKFYTTLFLATLILALQWQHNPPRGSPDIPPWNAEHISFVEHLSENDHSLISLVPFGPEPAPVFYGPEVPPVSEPEDRFSPPPLPPLEVGVTNVGDEEAVFSGSYSVWVVLKQVHERTQLLFEAAWAKLFVTVAPSHNEEPTTNAEPSENSREGTVNDIVLDNVREEDCQQEEEVEEVEEGDDEIDIMGCAPSLTLPTEDEPLAEQSPTFSHPPAASTKESDDMVITLSIRDLASIILLVSLAMVLCYPEPPANSTVTSTWSPNHKLSRLRKYHMKNIQPTSSKFRRLLRQSLVKESMLVQANLTYRKQAEDLETAFAKMLTLENGLGQLLQHSQRQGLKLQWDLALAQHKATEDLDSQKTLYESQLKDLKCQMIGWELQVMQLQERIDNPIPRPPPKTCPLDLPDPRDIRSLERHYDRRVLAMEKEMCQVQKDHQYRVQMLEAALRSKTAGQCSVSTLNLERMKALEMNLAERDQQLALANKRIAQQEDTATEHERKIEGAQYHTDEQLRAQKVLFQRRVEELTKNHALENESWRKRTSALEDQLKSQKSLCDQRTNELRKQRASNPRATVFERSQPATSEQHKPLTEARRVHELERAIAAQQQASQQLVSQAEEAQAEKTKLEKRVASLENSISKKTAESANVQDERRRVKDLEKILADQQSASQKRIFKSEEEAQAKQTQMENRIAELETSLAKRDVESARTNEELHRQSTHNAENVKRLEQALTQSKRESQLQVSTLQEALAQSQAQSRATTTRTTLETSNKRSAKKERLRSHQKEMKSKTRIVALEREVRDLRAKEQEGIAEITRELEATFTTSALSLPTSAPLPTPLPLLTTVSQAESVPIEVSDDEVNTFAKDLEAQLQNIVEETESAPTQGLATASLNDTLVGNEQDNAFLKDMLDFFDKEVGPVPMLDRTPVVEEEEEPFMLPEQEAEEIAAALASLAHPSEPRKSEKASDEDETAEFLAALAKEEESIVAEQETEEKKRVRVVLPNKKLNKRAEPKKEDEKIGSIPRKILHARNIKKPSQAP